MRGRGGAGRPDDPLKGTPATTLGKLKVQTRERPRINQREARLARDAENKVNESSADREARLARD
eukprot:710679-Hanusia_phi.AAC.1